MSMRMHLVAVLCGVLGILCAALIAMATPTRHTYRPVVWDVSLTLSSKTARIGDPVDVHLRIRNTDTKERIILGEGRCGYQMIVVEVGSGRVLPFSECQTFSNGSQGSRVAPGGELDVTFQLQDIADISEPGTYLVLEHAFVEVSGTQQQLDPVVSNAGIITFTR